MNKIVYIIGILALGVVIFNNFNQTANSLIQNPKLLTGFILAMIASLGYGILRLK